jgi:predicted RNase H-like nuclease (RuvC/YqgF family)
MEYDRNEVRIARWLALSPEERHCRVLESKLDTMRRSLGRPGLSSKQIASLQHRIELLEASLFSEQWRIERRKGAYWYLP